MKIRRATPSFHEDRGTPLGESSCNAWLTLLQGSAVAAEPCGDSTGPLREIVA